MPLQVVREPPKPSADAPLPGPAAVQGTKPPPPPCSCGFTQAVRPLGMQLAGRDSSGGGGSGCDAGRDLGKSVFPRSSASFRGKLVGQRVESLW